MLLSAAISCQLPDLGASAFFVSKLAGSVTSVSILFESVESSVGLGVIVPDSLAMISRDFGLLPISRSFALLNKSSRLCFACSCSSLKSSSLIASSLIPAFLLLAYFSLVLIPLNILFLPLRCTPMLVGVPVATAPAVVAPTPDSNISSLRPNFGPGTDALGADEGVRFSCK